MTGETMPEIKQHLRLTLAEGSIDPDTRVANGEFSNEQIDDFCDDVLSESYDTPIDPKAIPNVCVDGRGQKIGPNAAGGSFTLVMADALTTQSYRKQGETASQHSKTLYEELTKMGYEIGGHDADHAGDGDSGCGAQDRLDNIHNRSKPSILEFIGRGGNEIRNYLSENVGFDVDDATHELIVENSKQLRTEAYAGSGSELKDAVVEVAGEESIEHLKDDHFEVLLKLYLRKGVALDRVKLREVYGDKLQAFAANVPNIKVGTDAISLSPEEASAKLAAALYYNVATASVLAGKGLRVGAS